MNTKSSLSSLYFALALLGLVATWYFNAQYLMNGGGLGPQAFFGAAFANVLTTAITIDVYWSGLVFSVWAVSEGRRLQMKWPTLYVVVCFGVGLAVSLPLFLAVRERVLVSRAG